MGTVTLNDNASDIRTTLGLGTAATLNVGTGANNVVQLDGSGRIPAISGAALLGVGGKIKQALSTSSQSQIAFSNTSYADGLSISITPTASTSKILLIYTDGAYNTGTNVATRMRILRDATDITQVFQLESSAGAWMANFNMVLQDSPNTTSSVTYKQQYLQQSGTGYSSLTSAKRQLIAIEIAV